jgi:cysteine dioxygenase
VIAALPAILRAVKTVTISSVVDALEALPTDRISVESVAEILGAGALDEASLRPFIGFCDDHYARRLVHRSDRFDVMVLSWNPGQRTPVHNHSGQLGWVRLVRGVIEETHFACSNPTALEDTSCLDIDVDGRGHGVGLARTSQALIANVGAVAAVDRVRAIHQLGNPTQGSSPDRTVTLHVYSLPHDSCMCFDPEEQTCWRRELRFDAS